VTYSAIRAHWHLDPLSYTLQCSCVAGQFTAVCDPVVY